MSIGSTLWFYLIIAFLLFNVLGALIEYVRQEREANEEPDWRDDL